MKFDMSAAWRDATAMIGANREVLLVVAGIFFFVPSLILTFAVGDLQELAVAEPDDLQQAMLALYAEWGWLFGLVSLATMIGYLALLALLRDHNRPTVGEAIKIGLVGLLQAIGAYIVLVLGLGLVVMALAALAGLTGSAAVGALAVLIIIPVFFYVLVKVSLSGPVIAIEKVYNPFRILARSWRLTKGNSFRLLLFYLLLVVAYFVISIVVGLIVAALVVISGDSIGLMVNALLSGVVGAIAYTVFVAVLAAVHRQLSGPSAAAVGETFE
jgi:hypothetical protein